MARIPKPEEVKPEPVIGFPDEPEAPVIDAPSVSSGAIKVRAKTPGFFRGIRRPAGKEFEVDSMDELAHYMECIDPKVEKLHQKLEHERKIKRKAGR